MGLAFSRIWERMFGKKEMRILMVGLDGRVLCGNQPVCRVHFLGDDAAIQHERAAKFLFPHSYQDHKYAHLLLAEHALPDAGKRETHG